MHYPTICITLPYHYLFCNVVFREVLLNANQNTEDCYDPTTPFDDEIDSVAAELQSYTPTDLDYEGPHDEVLPEVEEEEDNVFKEGVKKHGLGKWSIMLQDKTLLSRLIDTV